MTAHRSILAACICLTIVAAYRPDPAFVSHSLTSSSIEDVKRYYTSPKEGDDALFDAEEAAAVDAHDVSDPGIEGAAMERAVILASEIELPHEKHREPKTPSFIHKIWSSLVHHDEETSKESTKGRVLEVGDIEADYAHDLSDVAALEHAEEVPTVEEKDIFVDAKEANRAIVDLQFSTVSKDTFDELFDAEEAAAIDAHDVSDPGIEGAAMERAVMLASELKLPAKKDQHPEKLSFIQKFWSLFQHQEAEDRIDDMLEVRELEAMYAHDLSDDAAIEHANMVPVARAKKGRVLEVGELEAGYAHGLSDTAAMEHANTVPVANTRKGRVVEVGDIEADYAHDLSDTAAMEHIVSEQNMEPDEFSEMESTDEARIASVEKHYKSIEKDIQAIEHLIEDAAKYDQSEGHSLERTFDDDDAADLALMMVEKSVIAATDKLELCQEKAKETENEVKAALEAKYSAKALAESIERDRRAAEMRFLSTEGFGEDAKVTERLRDSSVIHADDQLLKDALNQEHAAELELEKAIEYDIEAKKELEQMIENKAVLKQEFHDLEQIIHERTISLWKKENAKKIKPEETKNAHHFNWWHGRW